MKYIILKNVKMPTIQLSMKFIMLINVKMKTILTKQEIIILINVKMPIIVGILIFMSMVNSCLVESSMNESLMLLRLVCWYIAKVRY